MGCDTFKVLENKNIFIKHFWPIIEFSPATSGTNAVIEIMFFITNVNGTNGKNRFFYSYNQNNYNFFKYSYNDFYDFLLT